MIESLSSQMEKLTRLARASSERISTSNRKVTPTVGSLRTVALSRSTRKGSTSKSRLALINRLAS